MVVRCRAPSYHLHYKRHLLPHNHNEIHNNPARSSIFIYFYYELWSLYGLRFVVSYDTRPSGCIFHHHIQTLLHNLSYLLSTNLALPPLLIYRLRAPRPRSKVGIEMQIQKEKKWDHVMSHVMKVPGASRFIIYMLYNGHYRV
jgi:hypothetical protein